MLCLIITSLRHYYISYDFVSSPSFNDKACKLIFNVTYNISLIRFGSVVISCEISKYQLALEFCIKIKNKNMRL